MRRSSSGRKAPPDPEKAGWVRRFCGRGMFREVWRSRFLVLRGDQLLVCEREGKEPGRADEVLDLGQFQCCEEVLKKKNRSKKNHSRFLLLGGAQELLFLAVSPEEKDSWVQQLNAAISRGQNRILDQVTADGAQLSHPTRDRVRAPAGRRRPTRAHLQNPASSSDGMLTLDLIQEKDGVQTGPGPTHLDPREPTRFRAAEAAGKSRSLPREEPDRRTQQNRCASMDPIPSDRAEPAGSEPEPGGSEPGWSEPEPAGSEPGRSEPEPAGSEPEPGRSEPEPGGSTDPLTRLQDLIGQKLKDTERLLVEAQGAGPQAQGAGLMAGQGAGLMSGQGAGPEGAGPQQLLREAEASWTLAQRVLEEVQQLRDLYQKLGET